MRAVLVLLPPSETKRSGGDGPPLLLSALAHPELTPLRAELVDELVKLAGDPDAARAALGLSPHQDAEVARNAELWTSPTVPALHRYTGVLYDALDVGSLRGAAAARARRRLAVGSALFGLLRADDPVPAYRLSAGSALPGRGTLAAAWRPALEPVLARGRGAGAGGRPALGFVHGAGPGARRGDGDRSHGRGHGRQPLQQGPQGSARPAAGEHPRGAVRRGRGGGARAPRGPARRAPRQGPGVSVRAGRLRSG